MNWHKNSFARALSHRMAHSTKEGDLSTMTHVTIRPGQIKTPHVEVIEKQSRKKGEVGSTLPGGEEDVR